MRNQQSNTGLAVLIIVLIFGFFAICIFGLIRIIRKQKEQQEKERKLREAVAAAERQNRIEAERRRKEQEEREQKRFEAELARDETEVNFICFDGLKADHSDPEQQARMDRAYYQKDKIIIQAYDTRYKIAKIQGTSFSKYLTSMQQCTCEDFARRRKPCKHMYRLANWLEENSDAFKEVDYEVGLDGIHTFLEGTFEEGKDAASMTIRERGGIAFSEEKASKFPLHICVVGKSRAVKKFEDMRARGITVLRYQDILKLFTSEIRHPEIEDSNYYKSAGTAAT